MASKGSGSFSVARVVLRNFRCFRDTTLDLSGRSVLIEGCNGVGKTSILEALYYSCYLRSFRTSAPKELIRFGEDTFFIGATMLREEDGSVSSHDLQVGFCEGKRLATVDRKKISSYKELMGYVRVVSLTEDDLGIIRGGPQARRQFLDQAATMCDAMYVQEMREFRRILHNRNSLLHRGPWNQDTYAVLTEQLWEKSHAIEVTRKALLTSLTQQVTTFAQDRLALTLDLQFDYRSSLESSDTYEKFCMQKPDLMRSERQIGRSLFGAHLDDISITIADHNCRLFASRGQQKLIVVLLKIALVMHISAVCGIKPIFFLDDFVTDLDEKRVCELVESLHELDCQLIFTSPRTGSILSRALDQFEAHKIELTA